MSDVQMNDLRGRAAPSKVQFGSAGKIVGAILVLIGACGVGVYAYETRPAPHPKQHVSLNQLPEVPATTQQ
ncbi:MAG TPA: hypothetical protein VMU22_07590 [Rhizomicrobium sp.]|nr:hypothetical protein [Rhizomicrobium sp.]